MSRIVRIAVVALAALGVAAASAFAHADGLRIDKLERKGLALSTATFTNAAPPFSAADYDGRVFTADATDVTTQPTIHAVYLYPSDAPSRFADIAPMIQRDMRRAAGNFQTAIGRSLRWDERRAADGRLLADITVVRSKVTTQRLRDGRMWAQVGDDMTRAKLTDANKKYVVWVDAPQSSYCGMSTMPADTLRAASNKANGRTISTINRYGEPTGATFGFCAPVVHELLHSMGAVNTVAPNDDGTSHCNDNGNDALCTNASTIPYDPSLGFYIDYNDDDYLDPAADPGSGSTAKLPWWTVNLSRFLCPPSSIDPSGSDCSLPNNPVY